MKSGHFSVALIGFSEFERSTFDSFFRLTARRTPAYVRVEDVEVADAVIVDTDAGATLALGAGVLAKALGVGSHAQPTALGMLTRPINMMAIMRRLDAHLGQQTAPTPAAPAATPDPTAPLGTNVVALHPVPQAAAPRPLALPPSAAFLPATSVEDILVVDDSDIALRFMAQHLNRYGFRVSLCHTGEEALSLIQTRHYTFVFMDVNMPGMDGYAACRRIKQQPYAAGRSAPDVVMLTSRSGTFDKLRGTLAGCDAYLTKPLQEAALLEVIGDHVKKQSGQIVRRVARITSL